MLWRGHATAALAAEPRVAGWRRHALSEWMDGTPRPTATLASHAVAARLDGQRTPRTAAGPRVLSKLIAATLIHYTHIHDRTRDSSKAKQVEINEPTVKQ